MYSEQFTRYCKSHIFEMRPVTQEEIQSGLKDDSVSITIGDRQKGSPKQGDMIARLPSDPNNLWLVEEKEFEAIFRPA